MSEEIKQAIKTAFIDGIGRNLSEDQIKINMIQAGSTFKSVSKDYADLSVEAGLVSSKDDKEKIISEVMADADVSTEAAFGAVVKELVEKLKGFDEKSAASSIRWFCKKNEKPYWVKPKGESTRKSFKKIYYDALIENPNMTKEEADAFINGKDASDNVRRHATHYQAIRKLANAIATGVSADYSDDEDEDDEME